MVRKIGGYAFLIGLVIAIIVGIAGPNLGGWQVWLNSLLVIAGLLVGWLNVSRRETQSFGLLATMLIIAAYAGNASGILASVQFVGAWLQGVLAELLVFLVPAVVVAAIKGILEIGQA